MSIAAWSMYNSTSIKEEGRFRVNKNMSIWERWIVPALYANAVLLPISVM